MEIRPREPLPIQEPNGPKKGVTIRIPLEWIMQMQLLAGSTGYDPSTLYRQAIGAFLADANKQKE
jgi:predicted transcriptional regulator